MVTVNGYVNGVGNAYTVRTESGKLAVLNGNIGKQVGVALAPLNGDTRAAAVLEDNTVKGEITCVGCMDQIVADLREYDLLTGKVTVRIVVKDLGLRISPVLTGYA